MQQKMQRLTHLIWWPYYHYASTDVNPHHTYCPVGSLMQPSWHKYNQSLVTKGKFTHADILPSAVVQQFHGIYQDLTKPELLLRCLHG
jgi:hypothetical protein